MKGLKLKTFDSTALEDMLAELATEFIVDPEKTTKEIVELINKYKEPIKTICNETGFNFKSLANYFADIQITMVKKYKDELNISMDKAIDFVQHNSINFKNALKEIKVKGKVE